MENIMGVHVNLDIAEAKAIAKRTGADAVVVLAFKGDQVAGASYGKTKAQCIAAGGWMDWLIDGMGDGLPTPISFDRDDA